MRCDGFVVVSAEFGCVSNCVDTAVEFTLTGIVAAAVVGMGSDEMLIVVVVADAPFVAVDIFDVDVVPFAADDKIVGVAFDNKPVAFGCARDQVFRKKLVVLE